MGRGTTVDYSELKLEVEKNIPEAFKTDIFVREYFDGPCPFPNLNPYKDNGEYFPDLIKIVNKETGDIYDFRYKGCEWFFESLLRIYANDFYDLLPALFIYIFLKEYGPKAQRKRAGRYRTVGMPYLHIKDSQVLLSGAKEELDAKNMPLPSPSATHLLITSDNMHRKMRKLVTESKEGYCREFDNPDSAAKLITDVMGSCLDKYKYVYYSYTEEDQKKAIERYKNTRDAFFHEVRYGHAEDFL